MRISGSKQKEQSLLPSDLSPRSRESLSFGDVMTSRLLMPQWKATHPCALIGLTGLLITKRKEGDDMKLGGTLGGETWDSL